jgi:hypothetical protein
MTDLSKKCWRERVTAEITLAHIQQFAAESGNNMSAAEVAAFLNQDGRAHHMWIHMMQAGEDYMKSILEQSAEFPPVKQVSTHASLVH